MLEDERDLDYDKATKSFVCHNPGERDWTFERRDDLGGLRVCRFDDDSAYVFTGSTEEAAHTVTTVKDSDRTWNGRLKALNERERKGVQDAVEYTRRLGFESATSVARLCRSGSHINSPCTSKNVYDMLRVSMGELEAGTKGKGTQVTDKVFQAEPTEMLVPKIVSLEADLFYVDKYIFLLTLSDYGYAMSSFLGDSVKGTRLPAIVWSFLTKHFAAYTAKGQRVTSIKADLEGCFGNNKERIQDKGIDFIPGKAKRAERRIRWVKNKDRAVKASLAFPLFGILIISCVLAMVRLTNFALSSATPGGVTPVEIFTGVRPDAERDLPHAFGDYGLVTPPQSVPPAPYNSAAPRRESALYLFPDKVFSLRSKRTLSRTSFSPRAMPPEVVVYLHQLASASGERISRSQPIWATPSGVLASLPEEEEEQSELPQEDLIPVQRHVTTTGEMLDYPPAFHDDDVNFMGDIVIADQPNVHLMNGIESESLNVATHGDIVPVSEASLDEVAEDILREDGGVDGTNLNNDNELSVANNHATNTIDLPVFEHTTVTAEPPLQGREEESTPQQSYTVPEERPSFEQRRYPRRQNRGRMPSKYGFHVKVKEALKRYNKAGLIAMAKELMSVVLKKEAIKPVNLKTFSKKRLKKIISSQLFFKEKFSPSTGELIKLKARLVAGGHLQDRELYSEAGTYSPTVSMPALFTLLAIAAHDGKTVWCVDVGTAYLNAMLPPDEPVQLMHLDRECSAVLCWLKPEYKQYLRDDGTMIVEIQKALYGLISQQSYGMKKYQLFCYLMDLTRTSMTHAYSQRL